MHYEASIPPSESSKTSDTVVRPRVSALVAALSILLSSALLWPTASSAEVCDKAVDPTCTGHFEYSALWRTREVHVEGREMATWSEFQGYQSELSDMQLFDIETETRCNGGQRWAGLWRSVPGLPEVSYQVSTGAAPAPANDPDWIPSALPSFGSLKDRQRISGFELVDFEINDERNEIVGLFHPNQPEHELELDIAAGDLTTRMVDQWQLGYSPVDVEAYPLASEIRFAILWRLDPAQSTLILAGVNPGDFQGQAESLYANGLRPLDMEIFAAPLPWDPAIEFENFVGIWEPDTTPDHFLTGAEWSEVMARNQQIEDLDLASAPPSSRRQLWDIDARYISLIQPCQKPMPLDHDGATGSDADP